MNPKVLYFSRFLPTCDRGGGSRRLMQLLEALEPLGLELASAPRRDRLDQEAVERIKSGETRADGNDDRMWSDQRRSAVERLRRISKEWSRNTAPLEDLDLAFMDDPIYFLPLFEALKDRKTPVIAVCHNLESLADSQVHGDNRLNLFSHELEILSRCDLTVTISREENFLLTNLGIPSVFFPYYPIQPILDRLARIREMRKQSPKEGIVLLGSALNPQNLESLRMVITYWREKRLDRRLGKLDVVGYQTERHLEALPFCNSVRILGTLSNEALDRLLVGARACLCYQESGAGALTRIGELLVAGVPVLANPHAARSYHHRPGIVEFPDLDALPDTEIRIPRALERLPSPEKPNASRLLEAIEKVFHRT